MQMRRGQSAPSAIVIEMFFRKRLQVLNVVAYNVRVSKSLFHISPRTSFRRLFRR